MDEIVTINGFRIARRMLERRPRPGCGVSVASCGVSCCLDGVEVHRDEAARILANGEMIARHMDETQERRSDRWFDWEDRAEYPDGTYFSTVVHNGKCVFLTREGKCSLQIAAESAGLHKWSLKPTPCWLYPLCFDENDVLTLAEEYRDGKALCGRAANCSAPLIESMRAELEHLLGEEGYRALADLFAAAEAEPAASLCARR